MKMLLNSELEEIMTTEFQRGFEACRAAAVKLCRKSVAECCGQVVNPTDQEAACCGKYEGRDKTATECANEIARLQVPRFRGHEEKKTPCPQINDGVVCGSMRAGSERICPDCNPQRERKSA